MTVALRLRAFAATLVTLLLAACALGASPASAGVTFGMGDNRPDMFSDPLWQDLPLKDVRRLVEWDTPGDPIKTAALDTWMAAAQTAGARPLLAIERSWTPGRERAKVSVARYTALVTWLKARYPWWNTLTPWNEANYPQQPTAKNPKLAFQYWVAAKRACTGCTVTSPVFLAGGRSALKWLAAFQKVAKGRVKLWAFHAYGDQNRFTDKQIRTFEKLTKGPIWITETAGWVKFLDTGAWPYDEDRAAKVYGYIFTSSKAHARRVKRWYFYQWRGDLDREARWDSGVLNADGTPRAAYAVLRAGLLGR